MYLFHAAVPQHRASPERRRSLRWTSWNASADAVPAAAPLLTLMTVIAYILIIQERCVFQTDVQQILSYSKFISKSQSEFYVRREGRAAVSGLPQKSWRAHPGLMALMWSSWGSGSGRSGFRPSIFPERVLFPRPASHCQVACFPLEKPRV